MKMNLSMDPDLGFRKCSGISVILDDSADSWPMQIEQEVYKALPFLSKYNVSVHLDQVEPNQGYAFGSADVSNRTDRALLPGMVDPADSVKSVRIPIIVREKKLAPLDVFQKGEKTYPLTENRLSAAIFRPDVFDAAADEPSDRSMLGALYPPSRGGWGGAGVDVSDKLGSPRWLLPMVLEEADNADLVRVKRAMADPEVRFAYTSRGLDLALQIVDAATPYDASEKLASAVRVSTLPNVFQFKLAGGRIRMKCADATAFAPQESELSPAQAAEVLGPLLKAVNAGGSALSVADPTVSGDRAVEKFSVITVAGQYKVRTQDGRWLTGWVFPGINTLEGEHYPISVFTNGSEYAVQDQIAGTPTGTSAGFPSTQDPAGYGVLVDTGSDNPIVYLPMSVKGSSNDEAVGRIYQAVDETNDRLSFSFSEQLQQPVAIEKNHFILPRRFKFLALTGSRVHLMHEPGDLAKTAMVNELPLRVRILHQGGLYSFQGDAVEKLASDQRTWIGRDEAEFLCGALGLTPEYSREVVKRASVRSDVRFFAGRVITPYEDAERAHEEVRSKLAAAFQEELAEFRPGDTVKIAGVITDPMAVDNLLSLNFITKDNVLRFLQFIPELEQTTSRLAEMLVASRLGLNEIPETALERATRSLDEVILGLKTLAQRQEFRA